MTKEQFLERAYAEIKDKSADRISAPVKTALADPHCMFDTHCHIFDRKCINIRYFLLRFIKEKAGFEALGQEEAEYFDKDAMKKAGYKYLAKTDFQIYKELEKGKQETEKDWEKIEKEFKRLENEVSSDSEFEALNLGGIWQALSVLLRRDMEGILINYLSQIALKNIDELAHRSFITSVLMMDLEQGWECTVKRPLFQQIEDIKDIATRHAILPYFVVDPRRADLDDPEQNLYELFLKAFTGDTPFFGVKVYPSLGYLPSDSRLLPIYEVCSAKNIPVLTHCGGERVSTFNSFLTVKDINGVDTTLSFPTREELAFHLNNPENWQPVLDKYTNLRLNLAHFGSDDAWAAYPDTSENTRIPIIISMMETFPNVYADFSFNVIQKDLFQTFNNVLTSNSTVKERALFGTDYWVVLPSGNLMEAQKEFLAVVANHQEDLIALNPRRYLGLDIIESI